MLYIWLNTSKALLFFHKMVLWFSLYKSLFEKQSPKPRTWKIQIQRPLCATDDNLFLLRRLLIFPISDLQREWQTNNIENARFLTKKQLSMQTIALNIPTRWKLRLLIVVPSQGGWPRELLIWPVRNEENLLRMFCWKNDASVLTEVKVKFRIWMTFESIYFNF